jgi:hypothetical protein
MARCSILSADTSTIFNLPSLMLVASCTGLGILVLGLGLPRTAGRSHPWHWLAGVVILGVGLIFWGYMFILVADATNGIVIFFGALATLGWGLGEIGKGVSRA